MSNEQVIHIIEGDPATAETIVLLLQGVGFNCRLYASANELLRSAPAAGCVVSDIHLPGLSGLELLAEMKKRRVMLPVILMAGFANVPLAVKAMKLGAVDFIEKPFDDELMVSAVRAALAARGDDSAIAAREKLENLTAREKDVLAGLLEGKFNKTIAHELGVSIRTVETHRANLMAKTQALSLSELIRMSLLAGKGISTAWAFTEPCKPAPRARVRSVR